MLERPTGGWYRSTPHRVRNTSGRDRLSFPFFLDPDFTAEVPPLPDRAAPGGGPRWGPASPAEVRPLPARAVPGGRPRWDGASPLEFDGTYGEYLSAKVAKVFPALRDSLEGASDVPQRASPPTPSAPGSTASVGPGTSSLLPRIPLPITSSGAATTAGSSSSGHSGGRPSGVMPP